MYYNHPSTIIIVVVIIILLSSILTSTVTSHKNNKNNDEMMSCSGQDRSKRLDETVEILLQRKIKPASMITSTIEALSSLVQNMPCTDIFNKQNVSGNFLVDHVIYRMQIRHRRWHGLIDWTMFLDAILPYATLTEPRDGFDVNKILGPYMEKLLTSNSISLREAIIQLNLHAWSFTSPPIVFKAAPPNKVNAYSVQQVIQAKQASCTGESVFLVAAMRSVGIPARIAGVPHWNKGPDACPDGDSSPPCGNHNWVEAFDGNDWVFVDQNSGLDTVNQAWFFPSLTNQLPGNGDKQHMIYASSWLRQSSLYFHLVFDSEHEKDVHAIDRTEWYHHLVTRSHNTIMISKW
jgi:hypothetical protein